MTPEQETQLVEAAMVSASALTRIANAFDALAPAPVAAPPQTITGDCPHPADHCVDLGGMGEQALVHCTACRQDVKREGAHV